MVKAILPAVRALIVLTLLVGVIYPLLVTVGGQVFFAREANGSLIEVDGIIVGSELVGQQSDDPRYFWWRPSAVDYMQGSNLEALGSSGATNYGVTNETLDTLVTERQTAFVDANDLPDSVDVPAEMLFASGSGLDPHISPAAARLQIDRVAEARDLDREQVADLVERYVEKPQLGFLGEPRVNVLRLNIALDALE
ncbi:MAG: K(+)-transporting ATPase subunit C [Chloroflexi bacterium]|nr:K(+)-transporting ATPase subunit C [Chloroflexota bacterium]